MTLSAAAGPSTAAPLPLWALMLSVSKLMKAFYIYFILLTVSMVFLYLQFDNGPSCDSYLGVIVWFFLEPPPFFLAVADGGKKHWYF
tara:strand:+ start:41 stop:301 length:261 start_codon:yes stop_codon:yes gene_type:complete